MTNEQLVGKIQRGEDVNQSLKMLYNQNTGFISDQVKPFTIYGERDDLMQEAFFGLYTAALKYDWEVDARFLTYAAHWIRQAIFRYLENQSSIIRVSASRRQQVYKYRRILQTYEAQQRTITDKELCNLLEVSPGVLEAIRAADVILSARRSLDDAVNEEGSTTLLDMIADPSDFTEQILDRVENSQLRTAIDECVNQLPEVEKAVIQGHYLDGKQLAVIGRTLGKSPCRISAIKKRALERLRTDYAERLKPYYDNVVAISEVKPPRSEEGSFLWWRDPAIMAMYLTDKQAWYDYMLERIPADLQHSDLQV